MAVNYYADFQDARLLRLINGFAGRLFAQPMKYITDAPPPGQSSTFWLHTYLEHWRDPRVRQMLVDWVREFTRPGAPAFLTRPAPVLEPDGTPRRATFVKRGVPVRPVICVGGPWYGDGFGVYQYEAATRLSGNPAYVMDAWRDTLGLACFRERAFRAHPTRFVSQEEFASALHALSLVDGMARGRLPETPVFFPLGIGTPTHAQLREETDRAFTLTFWGRMADRPLPFDLEAPDGTIAARGEIPGGRRPFDEALVCRVPADGKTGDYRLRIHTPADWKPDLLVCPVSDLPQEVYVVPTNATVFTAVRYFWKTAPRETGRILGLGGRPGVSLLRLETPEGYPIAEAAAKEGRVALSVKPETLYRLSFVAANRSHQPVSLTPLAATPDPGTPLILSATPALWFLPASAPSGETQ